MTRKELFETHKESCVSQFNTFTKDVEHAEDINQLLIRLNSIKLSLSLLYDQTRSLAAYLDAKIQYEGSNS